MITKNKSPKSNEGRTKKRSLTIDRDTEKKIRRVQSRLIYDTGESWSYSSVVNLLAEEGLKKFDFKKYYRNVPY